jgi:hypothetical protein
MGRTESVITRFFPSHFPTLVMLDATTAHAGPLGNLGASLAWTVGGLAAAMVALLATTRPVRNSDTRRIPAGFERCRAGSDDASPFMEP